MLLFHLPGNKAVLLTPRTFGAIGAIVEEFARAHRFCSVIGERSCSGCKLLDELVDAQKESRT